MKCVGCCTLCGGEVFEVKQRFTEPPLKRMPRFLGKPKDSAIRATVLLSDQSEASITFCEDCAPSIPDRLEEIWKICLDAAVFENENRAAFGARDDEKSEAIAKAEIEHQSKLQIVSLVRTEKWQHVAALG